MAPQPSLRAKSAVWRWLRLFANRTDVPMASSKLGFGRMLDRSALRGTATACCRRIDGGVAHGVAKEERTDG